MKQTRKKAIRLTALAVSAVMSMGVLAGCGAKQEEDITTVTYWTGNSHMESVQRAAIEKWNETEGKKKGVRIEYTLQGGGSITQNLELALQSGTAPDIMDGGSIVSLIDKGYIKSYDEVLGDDVDKLYEKYEGKLKETQDTYEGKLYCVPQMVGSVQGLLYNKDMFKAAGIVDENGEAKPPHTLAEMREAAKKLTNPQKKEYGIIYPKKWDGWYASDIYSPSSAYRGGREAYNPATNDYNLDGLKEYGQVILDMQADGSVYPGADSIDNDTARSLFAEGGIGMKYGFSFDVGVLSDQFPAKCDWGVTPIPIADEDHDYVQNAGYARSVNINAASKVPNDKLKVALEFFLSDEYITELYKGCVIIPADKSIIENTELENPKKNWKEFMEIAKDVQETHWGPNGDGSGLKGAKQLFLEEVWAGKMTMEECVEQGTENLKKARAKYVELHPEYDTNQFADPNWKPVLKERSRNK